MFRLECCDGFYLALIHAKALSLKQTYLFTNEDEHKEKIKSFQQRMIKCSWQKAMPHNLRIHEMKKKKIKKLEK